MEKELITGLLAVLTTTRSSQALQKGADQKVNAMESSSYTCQLSSL